MTFNNNLSAHNRLSTMTATATRLALPITLADDFPYKEAFLEKLGIRQRERQRLAQRLSRCMAHTRRDPA